MTARKKTHLVYLNQDSHVWLQEHHIGQMHPENAEFFCEIPSNDDSRWIVGKPHSDNIQFLTLSPFYPSQRLDVSVEVNRTPKTMQYENHPAFEGCTQYMPIDVLDFRPIPKHIARAIYTIGLCHYGKQSPYKTVEVEADDKSKAITNGRAILQPSLVEHVMYVSCKANEAYDQHYSKKPKLKF